MAAQSRTLRHTGLSHTLPSGLTVRIESPADWTIYNNIFVDGEYDRPIIEAASSSSQKLEILDLGANVGFFSLRFADLILRRPESRREFNLTMVEGSPRTVKILTRRIGEQNALSGRYQIVHGLAGKREGSATLYETAYHGMNSLSRRRFSRKFEVRFTNLTSLLNSVSSIDLLKCDIEGAEQSVLETYPDVLQKTKAAVFEFHHVQIDYERCAAILKEAGLFKEEILTRRPDVTTEYFVRRP